jgi:hypothetical protein
MDWQYSIPTPQKEQAGQIIFLEAHQSQSRRNTIEQWLNELNIAEI